MAPAVNGSATETGPDRWEFPSADLAAASWRQPGLIPLLLRGVPDERRQAAQQEFESRLLVEFPLHPEDEWSITGFWDDVVARKPG